MDLLQGGREGGGDTLGAFLEVAGLFVGSPGCCLHKSMRESLRAWCVPEINITIAGLDKMDSDSQESPRPKSRVGHKVLLLKTLWRSSLSQGRRLEGYQSALQRFQHHTPLLVSSLAPKLPVPGHNSPAALFDCTAVLHSALSCPKMGVSLLPEGLQDTEQEQPD